MTETHEKPGPKTRHERRDLAAALRKAAPTLAWSTMSSRTATRRGAGRSGGASSRAGSGSGVRCMAARAPRCTW